MKAKKLLSLLLCLCLALSLLPAAAWAQDSVSYIERSWENSALTETTEPKTCTVIEAGTTAWNAGWYVASGTVTINSRVTVNGDVHLILADGCILTVNGGINVGESHSLTIYGQTAGTGALTAGDNSSSAEYLNNTGIGGSAGGDCGTVTIHGGVVTAKSWNGAGIGGSLGGSSAAGGSGGEVTIYGGTVTATSNQGAGIGGGMGGASDGSGGPGGNGGDGGTVNIYGGTVTATSKYGAGIGGGVGGAGPSPSNGGNGGAVTIYGGTVTATATGSKSTGIGGGDGGGTGNINGGPGSLTLNGGWVVASSVQPTPATTKGVLFDGNDGTMYGSVTLSADAEVPSGKTLTIGDGQTLTIPDGATLTNNGTLTVTGTLTVPVGATLTNSGTLNGTGRVDRSIAAPTVAIPGDSSVELTAVTPSFGDGAVTYGYAMEDDASKVTDWISVYGFGGLTEGQPYYFFAKVDSAEVGGLTYSEAISEGTAFTPAEWLAVASIDFGEVAAGTKPWADVVVKNNSPVPMTVRSVKLDLTDSRFTLENIRAADGSEINIAPWESLTVARISPTNGFSSGLDTTTVTLIVEHRFDAAQNDWSMTLPVRVSATIIDTDDDDYDPVNYTLTFQTGGGSALNPITRSEGTVIDLGSHVPTRAGYAFEGWYADEALTERVESVTLRRDTTVYAKWRFLNPFTDVKTGDYCYEGALWAVENGITLGTTASTFSPDEVCTRVQVITMLWRAKGSPEPGGHPSPFSDVGEEEKDEYYYKAVLWAWQNGIAGGYGNNMFGPDEPCTRAEALTFLWRAMGSPRPAANAPFTDLERSAYYTYALGWGYENGIVNGVANGLFDPGGACTRGQLVTMLWRAMG